MTTVSLTPDTRPPGRVRRAVKDNGLAALALLVAAYGTLSVTWGLAALKAAGVTGKAPEGANAFQSIIGTLNDNLLWMFVTCISLAVTVGGVLMALGHSRAQDHLIRIGGGVVVVLLIAPVTVG